jgi:hypothetical protein
VSPPVFTTRLAGAVGQGVGVVGPVHRVVLQALPVRSELAAPEFRKTLFFSFDQRRHASATEEVGTSTIVSTPSRSIHWRAMFAPTSGLFW